MRQIVRTAFAGCLMTVALVTALPSLAQSAGTAKIFKSAATKVFGVAMGDPLSSLIKPEPI